ncbi:predicted protein [Arabidopsis lyrata subsp. lyrata]|uniref:Predicted protein n=1 Tax=Arabidopsis lyrata subsp. lyrata TaxID=81972 RepID=D7LBM2_ARALL|nr:predicted protein [Arabidopsis lyrata subsp. lyrata]
MPQGSGAESEAPRISGLAQQQLSTLIRAAPCTVDASTGHGATDGPRGKTLAINEIRGGSSCGSSGGSSCGSSGGEERRFDILDLESQILTQTENEG